MLNLPAAFLPPGRACRSGVRPLGELGFVAGAGMASLSAKRKRPGISLDLPPVLPFHCPAYRQVCLSIFRSSVRDLAGFAVSASATIPAHEGSLDGFHLTMLA